MRSYILLTKLTIFVLAKMHSDLIKERKSRQDKVVSVKTVVNSKTKQDKFVAEVAWKNNSENTHESFANLREDLSE